jgi:hypothetical protein
MTFWLVYALSLLACLSVVFGTDDWWGLRLGTLAFAAVLFLWPTFRQDELLHRGTTQVIIAVIAILFIATHRRIRQLERNASHESQPPSA